ncbi:MAG: DUF4446 family protein [Lachnospiraceae bacterium]|nr:DUF4446 family protein [Lachnospiraceae bacterium]
MQDFIIWEILLIVSILAVIVLFIMNMNNKKMIAKLTKRVDDLTSGGDGKSLEAELDQIIEDNRRLLDDSDRNSEDIRKIFERLKAVYQKMSIVKYDAYEQLGGEMSAVVVLLDENDNGVLLNNVYSPEGGYIYTREIENGKCRHELGAEEEQALAEALKR